MLSSCGGSPPIASVIVPVTRIDGLGQRIAAARQLRQPAEQHRERDEAEEAEQGEEDQLAPGGAREGVARIGDDFAHARSYSITERCAAGYRLSVPNA